MRGMNLTHFFRTGPRPYKARPPANCEAARMAWDYFAENGAIDSIRLIEGCWFCQRPGAEVMDSVESVHFRRPYR